MTTQTRVPISDWQNSWLCSSGTSRYALVDEYPSQDDTDYTYTTGTSVWDIFGFTPFDVPAGMQIDYVKVYTRNKIDSGTSWIFGGFLYSTYLNATTIPIYSVWNDGEANWTENPFTGLPWTVDEVNGVGDPDSSITYFGYGISDVPAVVHYVSRTYIEVSYSIPPPPKHGSYSYII